MPHCQVITLQKNALKTCMQVYFGFTTFADLITKQNCNKLASSSCFSILFSAKKIS